MAITTLQLKQTALVLVIAVAVAAPFCQARRLLKSRFEGVGDPDGTSAYNNARSWDLKSSSSRSALTPEAAESSATTAFGGIYRNVAKRATYATVEADPISSNPDRKKQVVKPRARSAQDIPRGGPNLSSGAPQTSVLLIGGGAVSQTYEGATAVAGSEGLFVNQGKKKTAVSNSHLTASTGSQRRASRAGSFGMTGQPVGSMALSGAANGKVVLAQADNAVAMSTTEKQSTMSSSWNGFHRHH